MDQVEAYAVHSRRIDVRVEKGEVKTARTSVVTGIGIRAITSKAVGFSFTTNPENYEKSLEEACSMARAGRPDPDFKSLPADLKSNLANGANGEFSGLILSGFLVENEEITKGLKQTMCGINILLENIDAVGDDIRDVGGILAPSIRIRQAMITSRKG